VFVVVVLLVPGAFLVRRSRRLRAARIAFFGRFIDRDRAAFHAHALRAPGAAVLLDAVDVVERDLDFSDVADLEEDRVLRVGADDSVDPGSVLQINGVGSELGRESAEKDDRREDDERRQKTFAGHESPRLREFETSLESFGW